MFTTAFSQIRLSGQNVTTASGRLLVAGAPTMMASDSGAFTSSAVVQNTGQALYTLLTNLSGQANTNYATAANLTTTNTNLTTTGQTLVGLIGGLSGVVNTMVAAGSRQIFVTGIPTGSDAFYVNFPTGFGIIPKIQTTIEVTNPILYQMVVSGRSTTGFMSLWSDIIAESGVSLHVTASI